MIHLRGGTLQALASACGAALAVFLAIWPVAAQDGVRFLELREVRDTLLLQEGSGLAESEIREPGKWDKWIRKRDAEIRARVDRGIEDTISNLILYGTSFTSLPRVDSLESAATELGELSEAARARIGALETALRSGGANDRLKYVRDFLARKQIRADSSGPFLAANLRRFLAEQRSYEARLREAASAGDPTTVFLARGDLYQRRGLSVDTSLLPNFALEQTLRAMSVKGAVAQGAVARIAIVGPGLDFTDKRDGYDFYPLQTLQPFAVMEAVERLGLASKSGVQLVCLDLNPAVLHHVETLAAAGRAGRGYTVQLPRQADAGWSPAAISYWEHFGEILGSPVKPLPVPAALGGVTSRAVRIRPQFAAPMRGLDLDIVAQTRDFAPGQGFDLVIATNILVYYDRLEQTLAMANIARMMNEGGFFLANTVLPAQHTPDLIYLGRRPTAYTSKGEFGDDVVVYRRR